MRRALIVGINHYKGGPLDGCINDAKNMYEVLNRHDDGNINFDCKLIVSKDESQEKRITVTRLKKEIFNLFHQEAEIAVLYFSGHGASTEIGNYLVTQDVKKYQEGVSLEEVITLANSSKVNEVIIILDCCYGGSLGNLREIGGRKALLREGVSILTASRDTQFSFERNDSDQGLFTSIIYDALEGGAADILGNVNVSGLYNYVDQLLNSWEQRPIFKSHVSKMVSLRKCTPKIKLETLKKITNYFPGKNYKFPLNPTFDKDLDSSNKDNQDIMKDLREYYRLELLVPIGEEYMYHAAENSKPCQLTKKGKYFWEMVKNNRI
ncbi:caspase family protein [Aquimarina litoralis]|uniref:caspase family protein n=1 Tax=Aquimarina litoralis TaxID=584605 RepID=UPI001C5A22DA|nr:caspase family protein [Aquimarina litoralis]